MSLYDASHPDPMHLIDYAAGRLDRSQATHVRDHCMRCETCGDQLAAIIILRRSEAGRAASRRQYPSIRWAGAALAVAATLVVGVLLVRSPRAGGFVPTQAVGGGPGSGTRMVLQPDLRKLRTIGVLMRLVSRSAQDYRQANRETGRELWNKTAELLVKGEPRAVVALLAQRPQVMDRRLLGVRAISSFLTGDDAEDTIAQLREWSSALAPDEDGLDATLARVATWLLARHYVEAARPWEASALLHSLLTADDASARDAGQLLVERH